MSLAPETVDALRRAAATRADIGRIVFVEQRVVPETEPPFPDRRIVVVLDDAPVEAPPRAFVHKLVQLLMPPLRDVGRVGMSLPSPIGTEPATRGGTVLYERNDGA